ncbi:MAG: tetratricopeptide repeat protein [Rhodospirillaceae bacterium]|jgi:tetratricopeptide (TPR) repeat protein|nr:tetratricopeptide repeat protein [Rhodospirillaceae bacterium]MBT7268494.1 tetratricopeptide repeat protein [Rhodospirillaceae bacterium]
MDLIETFSEVTALLEVHNLAEALVCLDRVEAEIPDTGPMQKIAGQLYQRLGEDARSLTYLTRAQELLPDDTSLLLSLGYHHLDNGAPGEAADYFSRYLEVEPATSRILCFLGRAHDHNGNKAEAEKILRQAVALEPSDLEPQLHLGRVLMLNGKYDEALECFKILQFFYPDDFMVDCGLRRAAAFVAGSVETNIQTRSAEPATVVCVKYGTKYGPDYVNRLASMVQRLSSVEVDIVCFTEDPTGIEEGVRTIPLPELNSKGEALEGWWNKLSLFREDIAGVGSHMLYMDVDVVLTGSIDDLLFYDSDFAIAVNSYAPSFSSSIMRFKTGSRPDIWTDFSDEDVDRLPGDEDWIASKVPDADLFPEPWCTIYRLHAVHGVPKGAKVVSFGGLPNPDDFPAPWIKDYWY